MNLTRMREAKWEEKIGEYWEEYRKNIVWGDQDLINIFFHFAPGEKFSYRLKWKVTLLSM